MKPTTVGDFLIILPAHNEAGAIADTVRVLFAHLHHSPFWKNRSYTVLVADNGSTDQTQEVAAAQTTQYPNLIVTNTKKAGRGNALKESFIAFSARYYLYMDCDLPIALTHLDQMGELLQSGTADTVIATRNDTKRPALRRLLTRSLARFNRVFLGTRFHDAQAGFKGFTAQAAEIITTHCLDDHFFLDSEALFWIQKRGLRIRELPVTWIDRRFSQRKSSVKVLRDIMVMSRQGLRLSLRHNQRPWKILVSLFTIFGLGAVVFTNHDPDLGWHLRAGELILQQHGVPWRDIFLYTVPQHRWIDHEWLVDVWLWLFWKHNLWIVVRTIFTGMTVLPFLVWIRRSHSPLSWLYIIAVGGIIASTSGVRVQTIGYFLTWILLETLFGPRRIRSPYTLVATTTVILFLWANLHGSFPAGLFIVYLYYGGVIINKLRGRDRTPIPWLVPLLGILLPTLVTLLTPYGIDLYKEVWELTVSRENHLYVQEWLPLSSNLHPQDVLVAAFFCIGLAFSARKHPTESLIALAFYLSYLNTLRSGPLFIIASLFVVITALDSFEDVLLRNHQLHPFDHRQQQIIFICYLLVAAQIGIATTLWITKLVRYNNANHATSIETITALQRLRDCTTLSLFNSYGFGGTLIFAFPNQPLFIDGRGPAWHYPDGSSVMQNYEDTTTARSPQWHDTFVRYNISAVVLERGRHQPLISRLTEEGWYVYSVSPAFEILTKERHNDNCQYTPATIILP